MGCSSGKAGPPSKGASSDPKGKGSATAATDLPLRGIRVVDFGQFVAGPMCGKMLLDQGADVIHIGPPRPSWNSQANSVLNMGKHLVTLDLKDAKDVQKARDLYISKADILIENFPPGRMDKFGLGADAMLKAYPGLIYVSMPGFASGDEEFQDVKAHEHVIMARAGVFWTWVSPGPCEA
ncbi:unnamed protein product [Prorocentrum cordatum]|uniref:Formyl-CoA transferase n=1 Tax=Prorocentrum cordatum TaxID=2364126 RepID=A0ABN9SLZ5_9DINO|nr:unnamed protein product [Polarella glacialis]